MTMSKRRIPGALLAALMTTGVNVSAAPPPLTAAPPADGGHGPDKQQREEILKKIHTGFILELGEILELDTAGTIKLSERLQPFDAKRITLRMAAWDDMQALKKLSKGTGEGDPVKIGRRLAQTHVDLAQVDQAELEELLKGLSPDKAAKAALFLAEYPRRVEHMARDIIRERWMKQHPDAAPQGSPQGDHHWGEE